MRTYQILRASSAGDAVMNSLIVGTAVIWVPIAVIIVVFMAMTADSNDDIAAKKAALLAQGQAGYDRCVVKMNRQWGLSKVFNPIYCSDQAYGVSPEQLAAKLPAAKTLTPKDVESTVWDKPEPWSELKCDTLKASIRRNTYQAKTYGIQFNADQAEKGQAAFKAHSCTDKVVAARVVTKKPVKQFKPVGATPVTAAIITDIPAPLTSHKVAESEWEKKEKKNCAREWELRQGYVRDNRPPMVESFDRAYRQKCKWDTPT